MYSVATVSNDMARDPTIYFRSRAFRTRWIDCLQDFVNEFHQLTNSRLLLVCGHGKKWKIELVYDDGALVDEFFQTLFIFFV